MSYSRVVITPQDIMLITGYSERTARKLYRRIRLSLRKTQKHHLLTLQEFCRYTRIPITHLDDSFQTRIRKRKPPKA